MVETGFFKSGYNSLSYCCVIPAGTNSKPGIIFVHAADGNRLGPHRMFVELEKKFNLLEYPTLRFDLAGCGDSTGNASGNSTQSEVFDVRNAVRFFTAKASLQGVILLGISRGARLCLEAAAKHHLPIKAMILLSTPLSTGKTAINSFAAQLRQYIHKARDPKYLGKLLGGKANLTQIRKTLMTALKLSNRYKPDNIEKFASDPSILFIYGQYDPVAQKAGKYYTDKCRKNNLPCECYFIPGANHSFFHYIWKQQIFYLSKNWLKKMLKQDSE